MKSLTILGVIAAIALLAIATILITAKPAQAEDSGISGNTCPGVSGGACPYASQGGCTAQNNCGFSGCPAANGGSCGGGCGAR